MTGLVVDVSDTYCCIAPVVDMQVVRGAIFRLPFGGRDLRQPGNAGIVYRCIYRAIMRSPAKRWEQLMSRLVLSGAGVLEPSFLFHLESEVALQLLADAAVCRQVETICVRTTNVAECRLAVWIGASTMGAMAHSLHRPLLLEHQRVALHVTISSFHQDGPEVLLDSPLADALVLVTLPKTVYPPRKPQRRIRLFSSHEQDFSTPVYFQGWLDTMGSSRPTARRRRNKGWKPLWVVLQGHQLSWHKGNRSIISHSLADVRTHASGFVFLSEVTIKPSVDVLHGFTLTMADGTTFTFAATSSTEMEEWLQHLRKAQTATLELHAIALGQPLDADALNEATHPELTAGNLPVGEGLCIPMLATLV